MKVKELIKTLKELEPNVEINFDVIDVLNNENRVEFTIQDYDDYVEQTGGLNND